MPELAGRSTDERRRCVRIGQGLSDGGPPGSAPHGWSWSCGTRIKSQQVPPLVGGTRATPYRSVGAPARRATADETFITGHSRVM